MTLIATLLAGSCAVAPKRAVASVLDWVDQLLVLDSGLSAEHLATLQAQAGAKFRHTRFPWPHDFAAARNFALDQATQHGGGWAVTIDTDEQLHLPGYANQAELLAALKSRPEIRSWYVPLLGGQYAKDRFIRLPTNLRWCARVHEYLSGATAAERAVLPGAYFDEAPKTRAQMTAKLTRDREVLQQQVAKTPASSRSWFYLGATLEAERTDDAAIAAYARCAELSDWPAEAAWAAFKAASGLYHQQRYEQARQLCVAGRARQPIPELAWLAGYCNLRLKEHSAALDWARVALADAGDAAAAIREQVYQFKDVRAWFEAPHELMRQAYQQLGMIKAAALANDAAVAAKRQRLEVMRSVYPPTARRIFFDLGTHYGEGLTHLAREIPLDETWEIHAFEPNPACNAEQRLSRLDLPVKFHPAAIWTSDGEHVFWQENPAESQSGSPTDGRSTSDGWASCLAGVRTRAAGLDGRTVVPTVDFARILHDCDPAAEITVKMDIEGTEFPVLRHLITTGTISRIRRLYVEWHERFAIGETAASREALQREIEKAGVEVVEWG